MKRLNFQNKFLSYANEAVLPFYILHQTVLLCVGYYVTRWEIPDAAKFVIIALSSFAIIMAIYEFVIRRANVMRALFGMKVKVNAHAVNSKVTSQIGLKV
jgi:peptidoglycan/LPS O-acetylase OafA/YrhL